MTAESIREALRCGKSSCACGKGNTHCPAHDDTDPSLSVTDGRTAPLLKCFKGCDSSAIITALKARGLWEQGEKVERARTNEPVAQYRYVSAEGEIVGIKGRFESYDNGERKKTFLWKLPGVERWAGLGDKGVESMPLYNLPALLTKPGKPVFLVEGEKAVEALTNRDLLAVCLSGGASQKRFGNALDPLRSREVILWPDNDGPGESLMGRIASILTDAGFVRPTTIPKGDAWDYFENGGTVEALSDLYQSAQPEVQIISPTAVTVVMHTAAGDVRFEFSEMIAGPRSLDCEMKVSSDIRRTPFRTRINLDSQSARSGVVTEMNSVFEFNARSNDDPFKWAPLLSEASNLATEAWKGIDRSVSLADVQLTTVREFLIQGLVPRRLVTIPFGMGGGTKSLTWGVYTTLCALFRLPWFGNPIAPVENVLIVDYEDTEDEWKLRYHEVARGLGITITDADWDRIRYMPGSGIPLVEQGETIRRVYREHPFQLMIVDSCISAVGGDLLDTVAAQRLVNWLTTFGADYDVTSIMLAHSTKGDDEKSKLYPYGNIFWHNLPRSTVYVESHREVGSKLVNGRLIPRKASRGSIQPINYTVTFPERDGEGTVFAATRQEHPAFMSDASGRKWDVMRDLMTHGASTVGDIAKRMDMSEGNVRAVFSENPQTFVRVGDKPPYRWAVVSDHDKEDF